MHFIQRKQFSKTNVTLFHTLFNKFQIWRFFLNASAGPLKTLLRVTCGLWACRWTTLIYLKQHWNINLYSSIACEPQSFKRVFYLKQIFVIAGTPLERRARGNCPRSPLNPALVTITLQQTSGYGSERIAAFDCWTQTSWQVLQRDSDCW